MPWLRQMRSIRLAVQPCAFDRALCGRLLALFRQRYLVLQTWALPGNDLANAPDDALLKTSANTSLLQAWVVHCVRCNSDFWRATQEVHSDFRFSGILKQGCDTLHLRV